MSPILNAVNAGKSLIIGATGCQNRYKAAKEITKSVVTDFYNSSTKKADPVQ